MLTIQGQLTNGRVRLLYFKIFPGTSPLDELNEITQVVKNYDMKMAMFMGGDAGVESTPGVGTTVTVRLPRSTGT